MARSRTDAWKSIRGRELAMTPAGNLTSNEVQMTNPCVNATITIGAENANVRTITVQLLDSEGRDLDYVEHFWLAVYSSAAMTAFATGGSTGVAIGTDGAALAVVAKKLFLCTCESDGDWDGTWTDTGTESVAIALHLPSGVTIVSDAFANT